jgi:hypothetical protein
MYAKIGEGFVAEVRSGKSYLRVFSAMNPSQGGWAASVFDVIANNWITQDIWASDAEDGKQKAEEFAKAILEADLQFKWEPIPIS